MVVRVVPVFAKFRPDHLGTISAVTQRVGMSILVTHMETWLGRIQSGWTRDHAGREVSFQVVELCGGGRLEGSASYATLGLSDQRLSGGDKPISLELMMTTHKAQAPARLPQVLQTVGIELHARHEAILRGETVVFAGHCG
jgi:hypothetical protein